MSPATIDDSNHLYTTGNIYRNISLEDLVNHAQDENGFVRKDRRVLIVDSGNIKGRLPEDKYVAETKYAKKNVWWHEQGSDNKKLKRSNWKLIKQNVCKDIESKNLFVIDGFYNHDKKYAIAVRLITTQASAAYFFKLMSIAPSQEELAEFNPQWTMTHSPETHINDFEQYGLNSSKVIATNLKQRESIFAGTYYLAEINKVLLSILSYYLSLNDIGLFYCSATVDSDAKSAMFFGLSGSGKTTFALEDDKNLVTNEAVAWSESRGLFSLESGLTIKSASFQKENPRVKAALEGDLLIENPNFDDNGDIIFGSKLDSQSNTYLTFPRERFSNNMVNTSDPSTIIFLVKDVNGVLPRVSKLSKGQAIYYFLSGYTSTSLGIEEGVKEPKPEFSNCYAQPFLLLKPTRYANILRQRLKNSDAKIYMVNVGWIEGDYKTGRRAPIDDTRMIVKYILNKPENVSFAYTRQKYFNFKALTSIEDNGEVFHFENTWDESSEYKKKYKSLAKSFIKNYEQFVDDEFAMKYKKFEPLV